MKNNAWLAYGSILMMFSVAGCGPAALPFPTEKKVSPAQLVGKWQYQTDFREATIALVLKSDGSFVQTIPSSSLSSSRIQKGQ